jgi:hypothetical protein
VRNHLAALLGQALLSDAAISQKKEDAWNALSRQDQLASRLA